jgi:hypothetical protein
VSFDIAVTLISAPDNPPSPSSYLADIEWSAVQSEEK